MPNRLRFACALLLVLSAGAAAQDAAQESGEPQLFIVEGVADNDALNIRATASPTGMIVARLPNGVLLKNLGCSEVKGNRWCKVQDAQDPRLVGWAAGRYLVETSAAALGIAETDPAAVEEDAAVVAAPSPDSARAATTGFDLEGNIPCARYLGQPMAQCHAGVVRGDKGEALVSVSWPDGGERLIRFKAGKPESSNSGEELKFTREAELNMIRIGKTERFEITDALAFGG